MALTIGETIEDLATNPNYLEARLRAGDQVVKFIEDMFIRDWKRIEKREADYQALRKVVRSCCLIN